MKWILVLVLLQASAIPSVLGVPASVPKVTQEDVCLSHVIVREAGGEGLLGMRAVYDAIMERSRRRKLSVCRTLRQRHQFSSIKKGEKLEYDEKLLTILWEVRNMQPVVRGADFFHSRMKRQPSWAKKFKLIAVVKNHRFYSSIS